MIHLMLKYIPYRISLNKVIIISNQASVDDILPDYEFQNIHTCLCPTMISLVAGSTLGAGNFW